MKLSKPEKTSANSGQFGTGFLKLCLFFCFPVPLPCSLELWAPNASCSRHSRRSCCASCRKSWSSWPRNLHISKFSALGNNINSYQFISIHLFLIICFMYTLFFAKHPSPPLQVAFVIFSSAWRVARDNCCSASRWALRRSCGLRRCFQRSSKDLVHDIQSFQNQDSFPGYRRKTG